MKEYFKQPAVKNNLKDIWWFIKYVMIVAFIVNYFDILYGGYLWLFFVVLASICNSIMDTLSHHFSESIFSGLDKRFWYPYVSSDYATRIGTYKVDAWHLFKSAMIVLLGFAAVLYEPRNEWYIDLFLFGYFWNITFSVFYDKALR